MRINTRLGVLTLGLFVSFFLYPLISFSEPLKPVSTYAELVKAIRSTRQESKIRTQKAVEREKVRECWEIGKLIDEHVLLHKERADYGKQVIAKLAADLGISDTELRYMLAFARAYPIYPQAGKLSWSDYRELLAVNQPETREALAERAEKEHWNRRRLREEVRKHRAGGTGFEPPRHLTEAKPGKPGVYRVIRAKSGRYEGELLIDLGFSNYYKPDQDLPFEDRQIVRAEKGGFEKTEDGEASLFTYEADVVEVLDGDSLNAVVHLGLGFVTYQTLRLRGIDAPELPRAEGVEAKEFLEKRISGKSILIRTIRSDKYDRYLADVFVNGEYVNQKLLDEGLAVVMND